MDKLWAPWRGKYVTTILKKQKGCVFCRISREKRKDTSNYVVARGKHAFIVLNIYPYNNGHLMVIPYRHVSDTSKLTTEERHDLYDLLEIGKKLLRDEMKAQGLNVGINIGGPAGAGFPGHVHIHVVPRWKGDVNFMPVTASTKVVSQSLKEAHKILRDAYKRKH